MKKLIFLITCIMIALFEGAAGVTAVWLIVKIVEVLAEL